MSFRILVADESLPLRRLVCRFLEAVGIASPQEATDGEETLAKLKISPFNLIILDWTMSGDGPTGLELLHSIRKIDESALLVVMSTEADEELISSALEAGANDYLIKPFDVEARQRLLELCQQQRPEELSKVESS